MIMSSTGSMRKILLRVSAPSSSSSTVKVLRGCCNHNNIILPLLYNHEGQYYFQHNLRKKFHTSSSSSSSSRKSNKGVLSFSSEYILLLSKKHSNQRRFRSDTSNSHATTKIGEDENNDDGSNANNDNSRVNKDDNYTTTSTSILNAATVKEEKEDPTLIWARSNSKVAEECLKIPPYPAKEEEEEQQQQYLNSYEDYWKWRKWNFPVDDKDDDDTLTAARSLSTHVLSTPLTLAKFFQETNMIKTMLPTKNQDNVDNQQHQELNINLCCVGARAESSLPLNYWKEFLVAMNNTNITTPKKNSFFIDFVGPDLHPTTIGSTRTLQYNTSTLRLRWLYQGLLHRMVHNIPSYDAYVFFNPGIGHSNLKENWEPTLNSLISAHAATAGKPTFFFLTAHSQLDANRDKQALCDVLGNHNSISDDQITNIRYDSNPFASRITYEDPFDLSHLIIPNHYISYFKL